MRATKSLIKFDLYVGNLFFVYPRFQDQLHSFSSKFPVDQLYSRNNVRDLLELEKQYHNTRNYYGNKHLLTITSSNTSSPRYVRFWFDAIYFEFYSSSKSLDQTKNQAFSIHDNEFGPICTDHLELEFSMTTFEHLPVCL